MYDIQSAQSANALHKHHSGNILVAYKLPTDLSAGFSLFVCLCLSVCVCLSVPVSVLYYLYRVTQKSLDIRF